MEHWKTIEFAPNYEVSDYGRVRNKIKGNIVKPFTDKGQKYDRVELYNGNGKKCAKKYRVSRLVAMHFIPNPYNKKYVDHVNTNIHDNRAENLRWVTAEENSHNLLTVMHYYQSMNIPFVVEWTDGDVHGSFML